MTALTRGLRTNNIDGIGSYTRSLFKQLESSDDIQLLPISFGSPPAPHLPGSHFAQQLGAYPAAVLFSTATGLSFRGDARLSSKIDLMHATDHLIPRLRKTPVVATLMDAIPLSHPEWTRSRLRSLKNILWRKAVHWADRIITISAHSRMEIETHFRIPADRIDVIPLGVDEQWFRPLPDEEWRTVAAALNLPETYFLFVGTLQPRKNIKRVIDAHAALPAGIRREVPLVIVGRAGWQSSQLINALATESYGPSVRWLKHLPDHYLQAVMSKAAALVFPSLHEGFGLPVLEAFAAGAPVITSKTTALPEVAGDAALLVDPRDTPAIAEAMTVMIENSSLANTLRQRGTLRARKFSWERTASMTIDSYRRTAF